MVWSIVQLLFAVVVSPLACGLQGMGNGPGRTTLHPSKQIGENIIHGLYCFLRQLDENIMLSGYPDQAERSWSWLLVLLHVFSIVMVGVSIDKLTAATKVMYQGVSMGIMLAVLFMFVYQIQDQWCEYGVLYFRALAGSGKLEKLVDKAKQKAGEKRKRMDAWKKEG
ncbi:hypothetical protein ACHAW6_003484 [Cyclotella cf. meneghiniana]